MISAHERATHAFHELYYRGAERGAGILFSTYWMGTQVVKCPLDLWNYQEIMFEMRPDFIIETGTHNGGSALYLAHICDLLGKGEIITIDIGVMPNRPQHPRITYVTASSTDPRVVQHVHQRAQGKSSVMVILDSDHSQRHVYNEMKAFHSLVTPGNYLIVEDTNVNGHPVRPDFGPGPFEAVQQFMQENQDFQIDYTREKMMLSMNPCGFLRKKR